MECSEGFEYLYEHSACHATCDNPHGEIQCAVADREGCYCPQGQLKKGNECVERQKCGCKLSDGTTVEVGLLISVSG